MTCELCENLVGARCGRCGTVLNESHDSTNYYLPKITPEIFEEFGGIDFLIESDNGKNMQWSQMAVDFLVMINNSNRK